MNHYFGRESLMRYNKSGIILNKQSMKDAVKDGLELDELERYRAFATPKYIYEEMFHICKQEIWEENELIKTKTGRLLYV